MKELTHVFALIIPTSMTIDTLGNKQTKLLRNFLGKGARYDLVIAPDRQKKRIP